MTDVLEEIRRLREQNRDISNDDILLIQMIQIKEQLRDIDNRLQALEEAEKKHSEYPSLTYLLRYRPRDTMAVIALFFVILSMIWVSEFRQPVLKWLGLPVF